MRSQLANRPISCACGEYESLFKLMYFLTLSRLMLIIGIVVEMLFFKYILFLFFTSTTCQSIIYCSPISSRLTECTVSEFFSRKSSVLPVENSPRFVSRVPANNVPFLLLPPQTIDHCLFSSTGNPSLYHCFGKIFFIPSFSFRRPEISHVGVPYRIPQH